MEKEILEGNKLIKEFYTDEHLRGQFGRILSVEEYKYHTSWDWLMPVCKKLDRLVEDGIIKNSKDYEFWCDKLDDTVTRNYDIMPVFKIVVEFIEWYNSQNN